MKAVAAFAHKKKSAMGAFGRGAPGGESSSVWGLISWTQRPGQISQEAKGQRGKKP